ncbi:hypothetical protein [Novipirellula artificiosorum]|uniref:Uncharacterized protein n=1 Tax=Novipirellula artificiosorum TaxID=2528016 RepID=A0A5C6DUW1_9BACT|nr:hypothetical protein [Novipirellula artificiosorum]TWU40480.1 hypothetical protein Poly41_13130 [Novipirellula artificiosorum]
MSRFLAGMVCGAILLYVAMHYHVVRGTDGVFLVPKVSNGLSGIYTDIRDFQLMDWQQHKPLAAAMVKNGQTHPLEGSTMTTFRAQVDSLVEGLFD